MGKHINTRHDILRSYYNEQDKYNSDFDLIYPIVVFSDVKEHEGSKKTINDVLLELRTSLGEKIFEKQDKLDGNENNFVAFGSTTGYVNELARITKINNSKIAASDFKIPTEKAIVDLINDDVISQITKLKADTAARFDETDAKIATVATDIRLAGDNIDLVNAAVEKLNKRQGIIENRISDVEQSVADINTQLDSIGDGILDPDNQQSIPGMDKRITALENNALKKDSFGIDGKYVKDMSVDANSSGMIITETRASVDGDVVENKMLAITSSDNTVSFTVDTLTENTTRVDIRAIGGGGDPSGNYVVSNPPIAAGKKPKISYDSKGLVLGGEDLTVTDIPDDIPISKIKDLATRLNNIDTSVSDTALKADEAKLIADNTKTAVETLNNKVAGIETDLNKAKNDINAANEAIDSKADASTVEDLSTRVDTVETDLTTKADSTTVDTLTGKVDGITSELEQIKEDMSTLVPTTAITELQTKVAALETAVEGKADTSVVQGIASDVNNLKETVDLKANTSDLDTLKETVEGKADTTTVNEIKTTLDTVQEDVAKKADATTVDELNTTVGEIQTSVGEIQTSLGEVKTTLDTKADASVVDELKQSVDQIIESGTDFMTEAEFDTMWNSIFAAA